MLLLLREGNHHRSAVRPARSCAYGPNLNGVAVLPASGGNVPVERAAGLADGLLREAVSSGFVARANAQLAEQLAAAGFDAAMKAALAPSRCYARTRHETPVNLSHKDTDVTGNHWRAARTWSPYGPRAWYTPVQSRSSKAIKDLGLRDGFTDYLIRDDYFGWADAPRPPTPPLRAGQHTPQDGRRRHTSIYQQKNIGTLPKRCHKMTGKCAK